MLREERVLSASYDAGRDELTLSCASDLPGSASSGVDAQLLLDKNGFLVGVDVGAEPDRVVVMLGRHEDVDRTESVKVSVAKREVRVAHAKARARGNEKNPYGP